MRDAGVSTDMPVDTATGKLPSSDLPSSFLSSGSIDVGGSVPSGKFVADIAYPDELSMSGADTPGTLPSGDVSMKAPETVDEGVDSSLTAGLASAGAATVGAFGLGALLGKGDSKADTEVRGVHRVTLTWLLLITRRQVDWVFFACYYVNRRL